MIVDTLPTEVFMVRTIRTMPQSQLPVVEDYYNSAAPPPMTMSITIERCKTYEEFSSYRELLEHLFEVIEVPSDEVDVKSFRHHILRQASYIAKTTRRGAGNVIVTSPGGHPLVDQSLENFRYDTSDALEENEVMIMFEGRAALPAIDSGFAAHIASDGSVKAFLNEATNGICKAGDYGRIIKLV